MLDAAGAGATAGTGAVGEVGTLPGAFSAAGRGEVGFGGAIAGESIPGGGP